MRRAWRPRSVQTREGSSEGGARRGEPLVGSWAKPQWVVLLSGPSLGTGMNEQCESGWPRGQVAGN